MPKIITTRQLAEERKQSERARRANARLRDQIKRAFESAKRKNANRKRKLLALQAHVSKTKRRKAQARNRDLLSLLDTLLVEAQQGRRSYALSDREAALIPKLKRLGYDCKQSSKKTFEQRGPYEHLVSWVLFPNIDPITFYAFRELTRNAKYSVHEAFVAHYVSSAEGQLLIEAIEKCLIDLRDDSPHRDKAVQFDLFQRTISEEDRESLHPRTYWNCTYKHHEFSSWLPPKRVGELLQTRGLKVRLLPKNVVESATLIVSAPH